MTPTKAERAATDARDAKLTTQEKQAALPPPLSKEERAELPTSSTDPAFTGKAVSATTATNRLRHITHPQGRRQTTEEILMRLPVGSVVTRVEGGLEVRRRDGNNFKHGAGATLWLALQDMTGTDPSALNPEERKQYDADHKEVEKERAKGQQKLLETRRAEIAELAKVVAPAGPSIVRTEVGDRPAMVGSDFQSDDIEVASEFPTGADDEESEQEQADADEGESEQPETDSDEEEGLPPLKEMGDFLQTVGTLDELKALQKTDRRKSAKRLYAARKAELKEAEA